MVDSGSSGASGALMGLYPSENTRIGLPTKKAGKWVVPMSGCGLVRWNSSPVGDGAMALRAAVAVMIALCRLNVRKSMGAEIFSPRHFGLTTSNRIATNLRE